MAEDGKKRTVRAVLFPLLGLVALGGVSVTAHMWGEAQKIREIRVEGAEGVSVSSLISRSGIAPGDALFEIDLYAVSERLRGDPYIREANVRREAPDAVVLSVVERRPVAAISAAPVRFVDDDGVILPMWLTGGVPDVPAISGPFVKGDLRPGRQLSSPEFRQAIEVARTLQALDRVNARISEIHVTEEGVVLITAEGGVPVLVGNGGYYEKMIAFGAFWEQIVMREDLRRLNTVDIRYDGQVIARWKPSPQQG